MTQRLNLTKTSSLYPNSVTCHNVHPSNRKTSVRWSSRIRVNPQPCSGSLDYEELMHKMEFSRISAWRGSTGEGQRFIS